MTSSAPASILSFRPTQLALVVERGRLGARGAEERASAARAACRPGRRRDSRPASELQDADRVEIVDRGRVGEVAQLGRVAGDDDEVLDAELVRAEKVRDRAEQVAIAPADVEDGLDPELALETRWPARRCDMRACARAPSAMLMTSTPAPDQHPRAR